MDIDVDLPLGSLIENKWIEKHSTHLLKIKQKYTHANIKQWWKLTISDHAICKENGIFSKIFLYLMAKLPLLNVF